MVIYPLSIQKYLYLVFSNLRVFYHFNELLSIKTILAKPE